MVSVRVFTSFVLYSAAKCLHRRIGFREIKSAVWQILLLLTRNCLLKQKTTPKPQTPSYARVELVRISNGLEGQVGNSPIYLFKVRKEGIFIKFPISQTSIEFDNLFRTRNERDFLADFFSLAVNSWEKLLEGRDVEKMWSLKFSLEINSIVCKIEFYNFRTR